MPFPPIDKSFEGVMKELTARLGLVERRLNKGGSGGGGNVELMPPLPDPIRYSPGGSHAVIATGWGWTLPDTTPQSMTVDRPLWVLVTANVQLAASSSTVYLGVNLSGATVVDPTTSQETGELSTSEAVRQNSTDYTGSVQHTLQRCLLINAGETTFSFEAYLAGGGTSTGTVSFPAMEVIPLYWDEETSSGSMGPPGPKGAPGSLWYDSNPINWDPINVANPQIGDQFLYPISGDVFRYQGPNNDWDGWLYIGSIAGPAGPPGNVFWTNVEEHGAVGNGTTDDTAAIQAAINTGRPVYIPAKTFVITSALTVHSGTRIFGDRSSSFGGDTQSTIKQTNPAAHGLWGSDVIELQVEDVLLLGPSSGASDGIRLDRNANPATLYVDLSRVYVQGFGRDGVSISNAIVSTLNRVVCERNGRHGFNLHGVYQGAAGTSVALNGCYANNNGETGYNLDSMVYLGLNGCAAEHQAIDYNVISCQGISFTGCGSEQSQGTAWKIHDNSLGIGLYSCWSYRTKTISVWVTNSARAIVISGFVENTPEPGATNSVLVEDGCRTTVITGNFIAPTYYAPGTTAVLDDGAGAVKTYGDVAGAYFSAQYGGDFGGYRVTGVAAPVDGTDAVNKAYVDGAVAAAIAAILNP